MIYVGIFYLTLIPVSDLAVAEALINDDFQCPELRRPLTDLEFLELAIIYESERYRLDEAFKQIGIRQMCRAAPRNCSVNRVNNFSEDVIKNWISRLFFDPHVNVFIGWSLDPDSFPPRNFTKHTMTVCGDVIGRSGRNK